MIPLIVTVPVPETDGSDDGSVTHVVCCNLNLALCGERVDDLVLIPDEAERQDSCKSCSDLEERGVSCGARLCRLRRWLRGQ